MTEAEWRQVEAARAEASPTPWWTESKADAGWGWAVNGDDGDSLLTAGVRKRADAVLMAAAPALVDEVRRLRAALEAIVAVSDANPTPRLDPELGWMGPRGLVIYQSAAEAWAEAAVMARAALRLAGEAVPDAE